MYMNICVCFQIKKTQFSRSLLHSDPSLIYFAVLMGALWQMQHSSHHSKVLSVCVVYFICLRALIRCCWKSSLPWGGVISRGFGGVAPSPVAHCTLSSVERACRRSGWPASAVRRCARSSVWWRTAASERSRVWRSTWGCSGLLCRRDRVWATAWTTDSRQQLWRIGGEQHRSEQSSIRVPPRVAINRGAEFVWVYFYYFIFF